MYASLPWVSHGAGPSNRLLLGRRSKPQREGVSGVATRPVPKCITHSAAETKQSSCPSFSSSTSRVRASPVDCSPMTTHCGG